jgi:hypothetical protein
MRLELPLLYDKATKAPTGQRHYAVSRRSGY